MKPRENGGIVLERLDGRNEVKIARRLFGLEDNDQLPSIKLGYGSSEVLLGRLVMAANKTLELPVIYEGLEPIEPEELLKIVCLMAKDASAILSKQKPKV